jgi:hypothetical protein
MGSSVRPDTSFQRALTRGELLAPYGRRDSPPPASRRWLTSARPSFSAFACESLSAARSVR